MRITNQMMVNNSLANVAINKEQMSTLDTQLSTQKKISRPSEDPIIAIRALRLRTNLNEISQYLGKNIPDAQSWLSVTEGALNEVNSILTDMYEKTNQGSNDPQSISERQIIAEGLVKLKESFYAQGDVDYAGRYVFSGFKTDTSLTFQTLEDARSSSYEITQKFSKDAIDTKTVYTNVVDINDAADASLDAADIIKDQPSSSQVYRITLGYSTLSDESISKLKYSGGEFDVTPTTDKTRTPGADEVLFNNSTGELLLGTNVYNKLSAETNDTISFTYQKDSSTFQKGDVRPELYFDCKNLTTGVEYAKAKDGEDIEYTINYAQKIKVNTEASDTFNINFGRDIDNLYNAVQGVNDIQSKIDTLTSMKSQEEYSDDASQERITALIENANKELAIANDNVQKLFDSGNKTIQAYQQQVTSSISDIGNRVTRLKLTETRLTAQKLSVTDLKSKNEDVDLEDVVVNYSAAELVYNASLTAASKVVRQSLLDFL